MMTHPVRSLFIATLLCGTLAAAALEVRSAKFGSDNRWADVTAAFREMRINDDLYFGWIDGNRMAGRDPAPGVAKKLVVTYKDNDGTEKTAELDERTFSGIAANTPVSQEFQLGSAWFGDNGNYLDVTEKMREIIASNREVSLDFPTLGIDGKDDPAPGRDIPEIDLDAVKARIERELAKCLKSDPARDPWRLPLVAEAYHVPWCSAYRNPKVVEYVTAAIDALARRFVKEPEKVVTKGSWTGCGEQATALILLEDALKPVLNEEIDNGAGKTVKRRDLWCDLFEASTFQLVRDRRWLANQSQIVDNNGHRNNRAVHILDDSRGVPLEVTLKFMKEALGILPWSNGINPDLSNADPKNTPGKNYYELTKKFLSKEWGFVGNYGESTIWTSADSYEATLDRRTGKGDPEIFRTMEQAALARTIFRYPGVTVDNHPVMRLEVYIDWRNAHFPGEPAYVGKGIDLRTIYYTGNEKLLGCFKEMLADGYFQENVAASLRPGKRPDFIGLLHLPERYTEILKKLDKAEGGMPMRGEDFVFTDEEIGVVALKNGSDVFFAELYWRAQRGINNLAKIHLVTPQAEHIATVHQEQEFIPSGKFSTEPDWVVYGFRPNRFDYPGGYYRQLKAGIKIPQAEHADDQTFIGKAEFYRCGYGPYEIAMNATRKNKTYRFTVPAGNYRILPDGPAVEGGTVLEVKPGTTVVLYKQAK